MSPFLTIAELDQLETYTVTIIDSFGESLPDLEIEDPSPKQDPLEAIKRSRSTHKSSPRNDRVELPKVWVDLAEAKGFEKLGRDHVEGFGHRRSDYPRICAAMPQVEWSFLLRSEEDVARASTLYLLHPANELLRCYLCHYLRHHPTTRVKLVCSAQYNHGSIGRSDLCWTLCVNDEPEVVFAILELKNTFVLERGEFDDARVEGKGLSNGLLKAIKAPKKTLFRNNRNAFKVVQQISKYACEEECQFVGIFDWCSMVLFKFPNVTRAYVGDYAEGSFYDRVGERGVFRRAIFGFLAEALDNYLQKLGFAKL